jgi:hypothetical protein
MQHDVFFLISGNFSVSTHAYWSWHLRLVEGRSNQHLGSPIPAVYKLVDIPETRVLNGIIPLHKDKTGGVVLISGLDFGVVRQVNVKTTDYSILLDFPEMNFPTGSLFQLVSMDLNCGMVVSTGQQLRKPLL